MWKEQKKNRFFVSQNFKFVRIRAFVLFLSFVSLNVFFRSFFILIFARRTSSFTWDQLSFLFESSLCRFHFFRFSWAFFSLALEIRKYHYLVRFCWDFSCASQRRTFIRFMGADKSNDLPGEQKTTRAISAMIVLLLILSHCFFGSSQKRRFCAFILAKIRFLLEKMNKPKMMGEPDGDDDVDNDTKAQKRTEMNNAKQRVNRNFCVDEHLNYALTSF